MPSRTIENQLEILEVEAKNIKQEQCRMNEELQKSRLELMDLV